MKFWIDFSGYVTVEGKDAEEAIDNFWKQIEIEENEGFYDIYLDVEGAEERVEE